MNLTYVHLTSCGRTGGLALCILCTPSAWRFELARGRGIKVAYARVCRIFNERMADEAANGLNPGGGQKFRLAGSVFRKKLGLGTKSIFTQGALVLVG